MMDIFRYIGRWFGRMDWIMVSALIPLLLAGLVTMNSFSGDSYFFGRQLVWIGVSLAVFFFFSTIDWRFLRRGGILISLYGGGLLLLLLLFSVGQIKGAQSWFTFGGVSFQPADMMKIVVILMLAKYFSRRHVEIARLRHVIFSGIYALLPFLLILVQPDFGSAMIIFFIWFGMTLVSGISKKHLIMVAVLGLGAFLIAWFFVFQDYQKARIMTFVHPTADIRGTGYNAYQSQIAVGSGQLVGKGIGYGTQSRLSFLPEYETDFIFAAFAEEWGFIGVMIVFALFAVVVWRILATAIVGASNFEMLFSVGVAIFLMSHFIVHVGMNIGLMPVTGLPLPFLSYGGSHLLAEFAALGILMGMRRYALAYHRDDIHNEFFGPQ